MRIEINPRSLLNLEDICEVLYKLHPSVLDDLIEIERSLGNVLGTIDLDNASLEEREFLGNLVEEKVDFSKEPEKPVLPETKEELIEMLKSIGVKVTNLEFDNKNDVIKFIEEFNDPNETNEKFKLLRSIKLLKEFENGRFFYDLLKYIQLDTYEYIPMKIYVEVEDPVIGRKVKELISALEKTRAPEQFTFHKKEIDEYAYFAEGYGLTMNEEQYKKFRDFMEKENVEEIQKLLRKEKLYP